MFHFFFCVWKPTVFHRSYFSIHVYFPCLVQSSMFTSKFISTSTSNLLLFHFFYYYYQFIEVVECGRVSKADAPFRKPKKPNGAAFLLNLGQKCEATQCKYAPRCWWERFSTYLNEHFFSFFFSALKKSSTGVYSLFIKFFFSFFFLLSFCHSVDGSLIPPSSFQLKMWSFLFFQ